MNFESVKPYFSGWRKYKCKDLRNQSWCPNSAKKKYCGGEELLYQLNTNKDHWYCPICDYIHHVVPGINNTGKLLSSGLSCSYGYCHACEHS